MIWDFARLRKGGSGSSGLMLCGELAMLQASVGDGLSLDPFAFDEDAFGRAEVDVGGREVVEALVVAA